MSEWQRELERESEWAWPASIENPRKLILDPNQPPKAQFGQMEGYASLREATASHMEAPAA